MSLVRQTCQENQIQLRQLVSVKRLHMSPHQKSTSQSVKKTEASNSTSPRKKLAFLQPKPTISKISSTVEDQSIQKPVSSVEAGAQTQDKSNTVYGQTFENEIAVPLMPDEKEKVERALHTSQPSAVASVLSSIPKLYLAVKRVALNKIDETCKKSRKKHGKISMLSDNSYNAISQFSYEKLWHELSESHPFLVDVLNSVSGKNCAVSETPKDLQIKYGFIYSILLNIRWHEFSLL